SACACGRMITGRRLTATSALAGLGRAPGSRSTGATRTCGAAADALPQIIEVGGIGNATWPGFQPLEQQCAQLLAVLLAADQVTHVLAAGAVAARGDLSVDELLHRLGQGDVHGAHEGRIFALAKFGK